MAMFQFGAEHTEMSRGESRMFGDYALHVQCPWRIVRDGVILVGYSDMRVPPVGSDPKAFDPNDGRSRRDDLTDEFERHGSDAHAVTSLEAARIGDLRLTLADGCVVEILPDFASAEDDTYEYWRLFEPGSETQHFVVSAGRAEWQGTGARP